MNINLIYTLMFKVLDKKGVFLLKKINGMQVEMKYFSVICKKKDLEHVNVINTNIVPQVIFTTCSEKEVIML